MHCKSTKENALKTKSSEKNVGEKKVIKIDGIIIVDKIVYPIEKVQNTTKSNRKTLRCVLKLM